MDKDWEVYIFECYDFEDSQARATEKGAKLEWIEDDRFLALPTHEGDRLIWEQWLTQHEKFNGEIIHKGETLTEANLISQSSTYSFHHSFHK